MLYAHRRCELPTLLALRACDRRLRDLAREVRASHARLTKSFKGSRGRARVSSEPLSMCCFAPVCSRRQWL
eukprot:6205377-Pleurochrysis_carterae.AAC.2